MAITSVDILNLSHSLKDICEINCNTPECLSQTLKILMQYNLIQANLQFGRQFGQICAPTACPSAPAALAPSASAPAALKPSRPAPATLTPSASVPAAHKPSAPAAPDSSAPPRGDSAPTANGTLSTQPLRLDIADPFLADFEK